EYVDDVKNGAFPEAGNLIEMDEAVWKATQEAIADGK
ncbi:MAG: hypothetical protein ACJAVK_003690, partial [Akkermansiaceae bacterium]